MEHHLLRDSVQLLLLQGDHLLGELILQISLVQLFLKFLRLLLLLGIFRHLIHEHRLLLCGDASSPALAELVHIKCVNWPEVRLLHICLVLFLSLFLLGCLGGVGIIEVPLDDLADTHSLDIVFLVTFGLLLLPLECIRVGVYVRLANLVVADHGLLQGLDDM